MKNKLKLLFAVVLSLTMVMGMCVTSFSATAVMKNPNSSGVQLIGDTLIIQEDHYNFNVTGKALMLQCPGVTDILPNNGLKTVDIQFNGNMYSGITEILIVSTPGKNSKIRLDEGSMIITGVTTPEQVQKVKTAIMNQPDTLVELKSVLTGASQDLSVTKNYIVGKSNEVLNESGARVSKKEFQGAVELIADVEVAQVIVDNPKSEDSESTSSESTSSESTSSVMPTPSAPPLPPISDCEHTSGYCQIEGNDVYHECKSCHEPFEHQYNESGVCDICQYECSHSAEFECIDPKQHKCTICNVVLPHSYATNGTGSPNRESDNVSHFCSQCPFEEPHNYSQVGGHCVICGHACDHGGKESGDCGFCQIKLGEHEHNTQGCCIYVDENWHKCFSCETPFHHEWDNGYCNICNNQCPECHGGELEPGTPCPICGRGQ